MDSEAQKIIQRYFKIHETGIYVHLDSIKRKAQKRKKKKNSQASEFAPPGLGRVKVALLPATSLIVPAFRANADGLV